jgi:hypothetical protein
MRILLVLLVLFVSCDLYEKPGPLNRDPLNIQGKFFSIDGKLFKITYSNHSIYRDLGSFSYTIEPVDTNLSLKTGVK